MAVIGSEKSIPIKLPDSASLPAECATLGREVAGLKQFQSDVQYDKQVQAALEITNRMQSGNAAYTFSLHISLLHSQAKLESYELPFC